MLEAWRALEDEDGCGRPGAGTNTVALLLAGVSSPVASVISTV